MSLLGAADVRRLADQAGLRPSKSLGQNFVVDGNTIRRIVRLAAAPADGAVLEVGPGLGSLTLGLLAAGHPVIAVEVDPVLARLLPGTVAEFAPLQAARLQVVTADAAQVGPDIGAPAALVSNLPYNVAVPVLLHCLAVFPSLRRCLIMVQLEVADRLAAPPGSRVYGAPSVKAAWYGRVRRVGTVPPSVFWPAPRVDSGLVGIDAAPPPATAASRRQVFDLVDLLFSQRRKTIRAVLAGALGADRAARALADAGLDGRARAEQLGLPQFCRLAEAMGEPPVAAPASLG